MENEKTLANNKTFEFDDETSKHAEPREEGDLAALLLPNLVLKVAQKGLA